MKLIKSELNRTALENYGIRLILVNHRIRRGYIFY